MTRVDSNKKTRLHTYPIKKRSGLESCSPWRLRSWPAGRYLLIRMPTVNPLQTNLVSPDGFLCLFYPPHRTLSALLMSRSDLQRLFWHPLQVTVYIFISFDRNINILSALYFSICLVLIVDFFRNSFFHPFRTLFEPQAHIHQQLVSGLGLVGYSQQARPSPQLNL